MRIVEFVLVNSKISNKEVQELLGVKDSRALKILKELVDNGVLIKMYSGIADGIQVVFIELREY